ncbi:MAG TPA: C-terminal binding protein [Dehalococcoidia bacterium]|jgi:D-3-phosphoglycerate dehydrogenase|nr:hydroxyacid dehydrogenase [Chloroflexota bacterium]MDP5877041.1 C-terminal binding protein [Dehalococcoidia bacterium]MDP6272795.1 C-terminal binding protein [Dehalococcoidia bacterium]MDP7161693.1 C-terminal binding protein [Dehalococcoidia bacterium]MDP7213038.1 C-terminal binding protein [Dehalococcoidia bacterium]|tara:strand:+ start:76 stop:1068 length:993 start_codon:yes stop_codon:yes gene_type:complete
MPDRPQVVLIASYDDPMVEERAILDRIDCDIICASVSSQGEVFEAIKEATVVLNHHFDIPREMFEQMDNCKLMIRYGHGYDTVDLGAATENGVMVTNIAGATSEEVSNHALALVLACARDLKRMDRIMTEGRWTGNDSRSVARRIFGETLGIIGMGNIGRATARKGVALGMRVLVYDPYVGPWLATEYNVEFVDDSETIFSESDYVSLHTPLTPETHHLVDSDTLALMKPDAYVINTSRGPIVDEDALLAALMDKKIAGAALDVFEQEPPDPDNPLLHLENVIVTPHIAGSSQIGWATICRRAAEEAARALSGQRPQVVVNPEVFPKLGI